MRTGPDAGPVRFGILGCADIAWRRTLPAMAADPGIEVAAIASRNPAKAKRFTERFGGVPVDGYAGLLERDDVEAVYVPLPAALHAEWVERALLAGRHVLAEKPLTTEPVAAERLFELARARQLVLLENMMFVHHPQHDRVAGLVAAGAIGELRSMSSAFTIPPKPPGDIRYQAGVGGGALVDIGVYPVRAALRFLGPAVHVAGAVVRADRAREVVLGGSVLLADPAGVTAQLCFGMEHSYRTSYELNGSTGRLMLDRVFTPPSTHQPVIRVERQDHREEIVLAPADQFALIVRRFAAAVAEGDDLPQLRDASLRQAALLDEIARRAEYVHVG
ncbi:Gfo/Idh/MocA family oxidoreductase [Actinoplanes sp. NPDC051411]|uniref:Gfo/Idh/MocA family protein n=1 Tax=Actinoplanes sp. NPDC051411 TaxID=3155522 RepID=UPI00343706F0